MLIRSQNGMVLTNLNQTRTIWIEPMGDIDSGSTKYVLIKCSSDDTLGRYPNIDDAKEVLDMIQDKYINCNEVVNGYVMNGVFQMPEYDFNTETK